jgi:hypothetical protein
LNRFLVEHSHAVHGVVIVGIVIEGRFNALTKAR